MRSARSVAAAPVVAAPTVPVAAGSKPVDAESRPLVAVFYAGKPPWEDYRNVKTRAPRGGSLLNLR